MALTVPLAQAETLTVANGRTTTNDIVPIYGYYYDTGFKTTVVYPATMLSEMNGGAINSITFTANASFTALQGGKVKVSVGEIEGTVASGFFSGLNQVFEGTPSCSGAQCTITFDEPIDYNGGNLAIECYLTEKGNNYPTINFYGITQGYNASYYAYGSSLYNGNTGVDFLPEAIFDYDGAVAVDYAATVSPENLAFGKLAVDGTKTLPVTLKNKGTNAFTPTVTISGTGFSTTYTSAEIASKGSATISVVFNPTQVGDYSGTLTITFPAETGLDPVTVPLSGSAAQEVTINEGENTSTYLPLYMPGYYNTQKNQMIYPAEMLSGIVGKTIKGLTFYNQGSTFNGKINLALGTTDQTVYTTYNTPVEGLTQVVTNQSVAEGNTLDVLFDNTFEYTGGNLVIQIEVADKGTNNSYSGTSVTWLGTTQTENTGYYYYTSSYSWGAVQKFLPTVTFAFEDGNTPAVPTIVADPATVDAFTTEVGTPVTATVNVSGENLTSEITAALSGANADCFNAVLENGVLTITYNPTAAGEHTATVILSSEGADDVTIALSGTATAPAGPTITVPDAVTINTQPYTAGSASFTVTGANLTGDINLSVSGSGFGVTPNPITAEAAANGATVVVTYSAQEAGTFTGTITLTSEGAEAKTVTVTAIVSDVTYDFTVDEESLDFGTVMVGQNKALSVTIRNNGSDNIQPVFTFNNSVFTVEDSSYPVFGGLSQTYNIVYTPLAAGTDNGTVTISVGRQSVVVNLTGVGKELADYDIASSVASGVHNFGDAHVNGSATWSFTITNNGKNAVTPTITGLEAPFSTTYTPAALASGESVIITINFEPTEIQAYGPTSMVVSFPETEDFQFDYTLRGTGIEDTGTLPPSAYDAITYTWTDGEGTEHISSLSEIATDPDQMIALLKEVYTNKNVPGNKYRGYDASGNPQDEVAYPAIGQIIADKYYEYEFTDAYGWGMNHNEDEYPTIRTVNTTTANEHTFFNMNPNEYKPLEDGVTLLLVEMKDGTTYNTITTRPTSYASLKNVFSTMFKSIRVIPNSKKVDKTITGSGEDNTTTIPGTLFKIDCDKMNRFFFLAKGRLRLYDEDEYSGGLNVSSYARVTKKLKDNSITTSYFDKENTVSTLNPFNAMFEQFSPVTLTATASEAKDIYQLLINMQSYGVEHDCESVPWATTSVNGHEFNMYDKESTSDDCQDVRDLMFFVPDYRMMYWSGRDKNPSGADMYTNYYKEYAPTMGMYVIRQNAITGVQKENENVYKLHLTWDSNLTDFVPKDDGVYYIYQVNDDGTYTLVGQTDSQTKYLDLEVAMQTHGQQVTYVIQGQDNTRFLSLQFSNEESFIIPGTDPYEKFQLDPNAEYYSRYNPADEYNYYANGMQIMGYADVNIGDFTGNTVNYYRKAVVGTTEGEWTKVAEVTVNSATAATLGGTYDQRAQADYQYGYQTNPSSLAVTTNANGYKVFDAIYDNFKADVSANEHPDYYKYIIVVDGTPADIASKYHSNEITVKVFKTRMSTISGTFTDEQIENDVVRTLGLETPSFDIDVEHSSKTEVLRYGAYRWDATTYSSQSDYAILEGYDENGNEQDISPNGQASNQGEYYSVYMNGDSYIGDDVYVAQGETAQATFVDEVPANATNADEYTYAPVVETFTGRSDYNTYGAPMQTTATGKITVAVEYQGKSEYTWTADGNTYRYYNVFVDVSTLDLPAGYEVAKVRAWRKIDSSYLGEKLSAYAYRAQLDANGEFMFDDPATAREGDKLGYADQADANGAYPGTFGAIDVESISTTIPMKFFVRVYFKKSSGAKAVGDEYYITEVEVDGELNSQIPTSIFGVVSYKNVAGVKYYNVAGVESDVPFNGVNIVVTTYDDGSRSTTKILK